LSTNNYTTRVIDRPKLDAWYALHDRISGSQRFISSDDPVILRDDFPHCLWTDHGLTWYYDANGTVRNPWSFMSEQEFERELRVAQLAAIERDVAGAI